MVILDLKCGLGNQLFEYAYARSLMKQCGDDKIGIDRLSFINEPDGRSSALEKFALPADTSELVGVKQIWYHYYFRVKGSIVNVIFGKNQSKGQRAVTLAKYGIYESNFVYYDFSVSGNRTKYVRGVFQNIRYFESIANELKTIYRVRATPSEQNQKLLEEMASVNAVCMHIRRGDYITNAKWSKQLLICDESYYVKAMQKIQEKVDNPVYYVFSNNNSDINWIRNNYNLPYPVRYIDFNNPDYEDFRLMNSCKHFIMSNSSFSWWAQFLSDNHHKVVIAPSRWSSIENCSGLYMDIWDIIDV
ncbi:MAG TPA: alpha-1,2-fucosyltransferase [Desulfosporosinus sp.]|nr:alpha-1,2-fucosyltransferase [Desulfosporosinus sp.]